MTAYEKKETSKPANSSMDVDSNLKGKSDDTATRQDQNVSDSEDSVTTDNIQAKSEETPIGNSKYSGKGYDEGTRQIVYENRG